MNTQHTDFTALQRERLETAFLSGLYGYQVAWYRAGQDTENPVRNILKSRQIGATWYFAREMLLDAVMMRRNQLFIAPNEAMAQAAREYLTVFAQQVGILLPDGPLTLSNGASIHFSYPWGPKPRFTSGNLYMDEYAWIDGLSSLLDELAELTHQPGFCQTYYSTPSYVGHDGFAFWSGGFAVADVAHNPGHFQCGTDGQLRQVVTLETAMAHDFNRVDIERLRRELSHKEFINQYQCEWMAAV